VKYITSLPADQQKFAKISQQPLPPPVIANHACRHFFYAYRHS